MRLSATRTEGGHMAISVIALWVAVTFVTVSQRGLVSAHGGWQKPTGQVHPNTHTKFCYAPACTFIAVVLSDCYLTAGGYVLYLPAGCSVCSLGRRHAPRAMGSPYHPGAVVWPPATKIPPASARGELVSLAVSKTSRYGELHNLGTRGARY